MRILLAEDEIPLARAIKKIFEKNKKLFEEKWGVKWKMPKYRDGVTAVVNEGMMVEPKER